MTEKNSFIYSTIANASRKNLSNSEYIVLKVL
jgi:hypothetical protein